MHSEWKLARDRNTKCQAIGRTLRSLSAFSSKGEIGKREETNKSALGYYIAGQVWHHSVPVAQSDGHTPRQNGQKQLWLLFIGSKVSNRGQ